VTVHSTSITHRHRAHASDSLLLALSVALMSINVGIVGYGYAGSVIHPALLRAVDGMRLCGVATRDASRRQSAETTQGVPTHASLTDMLNDNQVQVVVVATPHDTHEALVVEALRADRDVVCEKAFALTTASADRMIATARDFGRILTVFQNRRWDGDFLTVKHVIESGMLGSPRFIELSIHTCKTPRAWRTNPERSGGLLFDWGAHLVDQALQLVPARVVSVGGFSISGELNQSESFVRCHMRFETGQVCSVEVSYASYLGRSRWFVLGEKGTLTKDGMDPQEAAIREGRSHPVLENPTHRTHVRGEMAGLTVEMTLDTLPGRWCAFYENLRDAIRRDGELRVRPDEARSVVAVLEAHALACSTGHEIRL
jgi:scyllo-inositol 2-dehydrogenase (NADP+)